MNQSEARKLLDSGLLEKTVEKLRYKLFKEFSVKVDKYDQYDRLETIHSYAVALNSIEQELTNELTTIAMKGLVK
jgi:hypothetical protein